MADKINWRVHVQRILSALGGEVVDAVDWQSNVEEIAEIVEAGGGPGGESTIAWLPAVSTEGDISFKRSSTTVPPAVTNIKGPVGADGKDGAPGPAGADGKDGKDGKDGEGGVPTLHAINPRVEYVESQGRDFVVYDFTEDVNLSLKHVSIEFAQALPPIENEYPIGVYIDGVFCDLFDSWADDSINYHQNNFLFNTAVPYFLYSGEDDSVKWGSLSPIRFGGRMQGYFLEKDSVPEEKLAPELQEKINMPSDAPVLHLTNRRTEYISYLGEEFDVYDIEEDIEVKSQYVFLYFNFALTQKDLPIGVWIGGIFFYLYDRLYNDYMRTYANIERYTALPFVLIVRDGFEYGELTTLSAFNGVDGFMITADSIDEWQLVPELRDKINSGDGVPTLHAINPRVMYSSSYGMDFVVYDFEEDLQFVPQHVIITFDEADPPIENEYPVAIYKDGVFCPVYDPIGTLSINYDRLSFNSKKPFFFYTYGDDEGEKEGEFASVAQMYSIQGWNINEETISEEKLVPELQEKINNGGGTNVAFWDKEDFGVEYKTNKIRNGKQVYKMLVDCGTITSATTQGVQVNTNIPLNISNVKDIWITEAQCDMGGTQRNPLPIVFVDPVNAPANYVPRRTIVYIVKTPLAIQIGNTSTMLMTNVAVLIEYTKTIDTPETPGPFIIEGLTEVTHDGTLTGKGTVDEPLSVIGGAATAGQVIGVSGTLERKALVANVHGKIKFLPTKDRIDDINAAGEWICPEAGTYILSCNFGRLSTAGEISPFLLLNSPNIFVQEASIGINKIAGSTSSPTLTTVVSLSKGDNVSFWIYSTVAQTITSNPSNFSITLQASIDITVWDMYQQWLESGNEGTFEEFLQTVWPVNPKVEYLYNTDDSANSNSTAFATGEEGVLFPNITTFGTEVVKKVKASRSLVNAKITIEILRNNAGEFFWRDHIHNAYAYVMQGTKRYGISLASQGPDDTHISVIFSPDGTRPGASYAANGGSWANSRSIGDMWRVRVEYPSTGGGDKLSILRGDAEVPSISPENEAAIPITTYSTTNSSVIKISDGKVLFYKSGIYLFNIRIFIGVPYTVPISLKVSVKSENYSIFTEFLVNANTSQVGYAEGTGILEIYTDSEIPPQDAPVDIIVTNLTAATISGSINFTVTRLGDSAEWEG